MRPPNRQYKYICEAEPPSPGSSGETIPPSIFSKWVSFRQGGVFRKISSSGHYCRIFLSPYLSSQRSEWDVEICQIHNSTSVPSLLQLNHCHVVTVWDKDSSMTDLITWNPRSLLLHDMLLVP